MSTVYGPFGDVFEEAPREKEEEIIKLVRDVATRTSERAQKELKLLPYRT